LVSSGGLVVCGALISAFELCFVRFAAVRGRAAAGCTVRTAYIFSVNICTRWRDVPFCASKLEKIYRNYDKKWESAYEL